MNIIHEDVRWHISNTDPAFPDSVVIRMTPQPGAFPETVAVFTPAIFQEFAAQIRYAANLLREDVG